MNSACRLTGFRKSSGSSLASGSGALPADDVPDLHPARAFHLNGPPGFAVESILDQLVRAAGDLNILASSVRFHAARQVHSFAPQVVNEFLAADEAGPHRTGGDANAERELAGGTPA